MISLGMVLTFAIRMVLVLLFLPFSALDKLLNFKGAVAQAQRGDPSRTRRRRIDRGRSLRRSVHVAGRGHRNRGPRLRLRSRRLLRRDSTAMEAILEAGGFLDVEYRAGASAVLGFPEEFRAGRRLSADYIRNRCAFGQPVHRASNGILASLSYGRIGDDSDEICSGPLPRTD